jgi:hypothetical protein
VRFEDQLDRNARRRFERINVLGPYALQHTLLVQERKKVVRRSGLSSGGDLKRCSRSTFPGTGRAQGSRTAAVSQDIRHSRTSGFSSK